MATALATLLPRDLQGRLLLTYLALMALSLGVFISGTGRRLQVAAIEQAEHNLELEAFILANALREPLSKWAEGKDFERPALEDLVRFYADSIEGRVTMTDAELRILASSDERVPLRAEENHPEFVAARVGWEQHDIRQDEWSREERLFVAAPVVEEDQKTIGFVQLSMPMASIYDEIHQTWLSLLATGGIALIATALVSLILARQIARPIQMLTAVTEEIAAGSLEQRVTPAGPDEIQRLGRAFNRMAERVSDMLARQQAFVANAAHELRSPLASLRLRLEMLQTRACDNRELAQRYLSQMEQEVDRLRQLVDYLLALSALDEGKLPARLPLDLAPLLYELADEMSSLAWQAGLKLCVDVPPHLPPIVANAEQMRIAVRNLLDNAIKYTPAGGQITLRVMVANLEEGDRRPGEQKRSPFAIRYLSALARPAVVGDQPSAVVIEVADTGIGIPTEALPYIFERFYRVEKAQSRRQGGAGLGLALVRSIIEAHGGRIEVRSQLGAGSVFTLILPISSEAARGYLSDRQKAVLSPEHLEEDGVARA